MSSNKFKIINQCRACGNSDFKEFLKLEHLPIAGVYIEEKDFEKELSLPLSLFYCKSCGLVQTKETIAAEIYTEYSYAGTFSKRYVDHLNWVSDYLVNEKDIKQKSILEIGCSDGYLLQRLKDLGKNEVFGYEPSIKLADKCRKRGIPVSEKYFAEEFLSGTSFKNDVIIIRHVLEHINELNSFLRGVNKCIKQNGILVIEVPDLEEIFNKNLYSNIFHQHLNYFSLYSLSNFLEKYGFYLSYLKRVDIHGGSIFSIFEKDKYKKLNLHLSKITFSDCVEFTKSLYTYYDKIRQLVENCINKGLKVYGYGAAERTFTILGMTRLTSKEIAKIYDKNLFLHNKYIPLSNILIDTPENIRNDDIGCLIIFATSFEDEILNELKEKYNFKGKIISIKNIPKICNVDGQ